MTGGTTIQILRPSDFDFTNMGDGGSCVVPIAKGIDLTPYKSAIILVRVHTTDTGAQSTQKLELSLFNTAPTAGDADHDYRGSALGTALTVTLDDTSSPGTVSVSSEITGLAEVGEVRMTATQSPTADTMTVRISVDLALKVD